MKNVNLLSLIWLLSLVSGLAFGIVYSPTEKTPYEELIAKKKRDRINSQSNLEIERINQEESGKYFQAEKAYETFLKKQKAAIDAEIAALSKQK